MEDNENPQRGDLVIFPAGHSAKMVWLMNSDGSD